MQFLNLKKRIQFVLIILIICNIIPTCAGYRTGITKSFACPAILDLQMGGAMPNNLTLPRIINFSPQIVSNKERVFVNVEGIGFDRDSRLSIKGFLIGKKYLKVISNEILVVKVPKGVPEGKYPIALKNPDGKTSNVVWVEVKS